MPWLAVILRDIGAGDRQLALALLALPAGTLLAGPLWATIADRSGRPGGVLRAASITAAAGVSVMALSSGWWGIASGLLLFAVGRAPQLPLVDVLVVRTLGAAREHYGRVRLWGSIAFLLVVWGCGPLREFAPRGPLVVGALMAWAAVAATWRLPPVAPEPAPALLPALSALLRHPVLMPLLLVAFLHGTTLGVYNLLFSLHVESAGLSGRVVGTAVATGVAVEVAVMAVSPKLFARVGLMLPMVIGVASGIPRWWFTASADDARSMVLLQSLHGVGFGAWWMASVATFTERAPRALRNATQALLPATSHGAASLLAMGGAAALLADLGTAGLLRACAGLSLAATAVLGWVALRGRSRGTTSLPSPGEGSHRSPRSYTD